MSFVNVLVKLLSKVKSINTILTPRFPVLGLAYPHGEHDQAVDFRTI